MRPPVVRVRKMRAGMIPRFLVVTKWATAKQRTTAPTTSRAMTAGLLTVGSGNHRRRQQKVQISMWKGGRTRVVRSLLKANDNACQSARQQAETDPIKLPLEVLP